ncbi:hypothetical protein JTE90_010376 [Oedothorax gibbosus]|uniref:Uncharacterized protein n=1 Tax=Oedothorax gibbosus TaxID=931172 RepID=A0AAV6VZF7_9ARAC|nr:hypothetical protein JTE90_010376 [Oedothorax gibbosus]
MDDQEDQRVTMVSTWSSGSPFTSDMPTFSGSLGGFTFIDFLPECSSRGGIFTSPEYENFRTLVDRANNWLRSNPKCQVKTCESIEFTARGNNVNSEKMVFVQYGETSTRYIRGLRLWLSETPGEEENKGQQIGYFNLIPEQIKSGGFFTTPTFESLNDLLSRFNNMLHTNPIPGRILTIESQEMKMSSFKDIDPDKSTWVAYGSRHNHFLFFIRVFYEISDGIPEEIGIVDFPPDPITSGGVFTMPKYELFSNVVQKASNWCAVQQGIRICNIQSLEMKINRGLDVDTHKMSYMESGNLRTYYLRILRVAFTKPRMYNGELFPVQYLTCKTFSPPPLTRGILVPEFETLQQTKTRVQAWVKATGVQVISAETTAIRMYTGGEAKLGAEASFTYNVAEKSEYFIFIIRLYINGYYSEPPPDMLPPIPEVEQNCCIVS